MGTIGPLAAISTNLSPVRGPFPMGSVISYSIFVERIGGSSSIISIPDILATHTFVYVVSWLGNEIGYVA